MVTLYLSNNIIQAVLGHASGRNIVIEKLYTIHDSYKCIINGIVTDPDAFTMMIKSFFEDNSIPSDNVTLVIYSSEFVVRNFDLPVMNKKNTRNFVVNEFLDVERTTDPVYTWFNISDSPVNNKYGVFAVMTERSFIKSYIDLFASAGINVSSIKPAIGCAITALQSVPSIKGATCIVQLLVDGMNITSLMFDNGRYRYSSRQRVLGQRGTFEFADEQTQPVSGIVQFARAESMDNSITNIFTSGFSEDEVSNFSEYARRSVPGITVSQLSLGNAVTLSESLRSSDITGYVFPLGGFFKTVGGPDLYTAASSTALDVAEKKKKLKYFILPGALLTATVVTALAVFVAGAIYRSKTNSINEYINSAEVTSAIAEYNSNLTEISRLNANIAGYKGALEDIATYPIANSSINDVLARCASGLAEIEIVSFSAATGVLRFDAFSRDVDSIHSFIKFIDRLRDESIFESVDYTGYQFNDGAEAWSINVTCRLAEGAGGTGR